MSSGTEFAIVPPPQKPGHEENSVQYNPTLEELVQDTVSGWSFLAVLDATFLSAHCARLSSLPSTRPSQERARQNAVLNYFDAHLSIQHG
jgi:hypothetical protein